MRLRCWAALLAAATILCGGVAHAQDEPPPGAGDDVESSDPATPERQASIPFAGDKTVTYRGVLVHIDWWVPVPEQWDINRPALLDLRFSHSPVLIERLSSMTASVNDKAVDSMFLNIQNARDGKVVWQVNPEYLKPGEMNRINLTAKMRSDLELCDDVHSPALWLTLEKESRLVIRYSPASITPDVSKFPASYLRPENFYSADKTEHTHAVFVVPMDPSTEVLEGMAVVASRIGADTHFPRGKFAVWAVESFGSDVRSRLAEHNLIVIGDTAFINKMVAAGLDVRSAGVAETAAGTGYIIETYNPWSRGRRALVVTGVDDDSISKAVAALSLPHLSKQWEAREGEPPLQAVAYSRKPTVPAVDASGQTGTVTIRMSDLGATDHTSRGKFHHFQQVSFPNPFVGRIKSPAFARIFLSHSELLLPQTSSMLIKVNGDPVRSVRLSPRTAPKLVADVIIPEKFLGERVIVLDIEYFLDIGDADCHYNFPEMAWVTLFADSFVAFPLTDAPTTSLRSYPWVVAKNPNLNGLTFVVADAPNDESLTALVNVAAFLGKSVPRTRDAAGKPVAPWVHPWVRRVSELQDGNVKDHDIVLLGGFDLVRKNPRIAAAVPESLFSDAAAAPENLKTYSAAGYRNEAGWIHLAPSPWNSRRNLLVVSGKRGGPAVAQGAEFLWSQRRVEQLGGSTVLIGPNGSMQVLIPAPGEEAQAAPLEPLSPKVPAAAKTLEVAEEEAAEPVKEEEPKATGAPAAPKSKHQVAYVVFVILGLLLVVLVVVRIRDSIRGERGAA